MHVLVCQFSYAYTYMWLVYGFDEDQLKNTINTHAKKIDYVFYFFITTRLLIMKQIGGPMYLKYRHP